MDTKICNLWLGIEEDLSRIMGDVPAHMLGRTVRAMGAALRQFIGGSGAHVLES